MGGRPLSAMALIALGFRNLSMAATAIGPVKAMVVSLDAGAAALELQALLTDPDRHGSLRAPLQALAERLAVRL
jgi:phosphotransferase system enzyme I (PtsP)